ncbi:hypothetical protein BDW62DRAFT_175674 [Aspergillus aurantiobrunneus]
MAGEHAGLSFVEVTWAFFLFCLLFTGASQWYEALGLAGLQSTKAAQFPRPGVEDPHQERQPCRVSS